MGGQGTRTRSQHISECVTCPTPRDGGQGMNGRDTGHGVGIVSDGGHQVSDGGSCRRRGVDGGLHLGHRERGDPDRLEDGASSGNPLEADR